MVALDAFGLDIGMQLGKLGVSQRPQALSCKTVAFGTQVNQWLTGEKQNLYPAAAPGPHKEQRPRSTKIGGVGTRGSQSLIGFDLAESRARKASAAIRAPNATGAAVAYEIENSRDRPLSFDWRAPNIGRMLGLPSARNAALETSMMSILACAILAAETGQRVSYSRAKGFYANSSRYRGTAYTYVSVLAAIAALNAAGLILDARARPGRRRVHRKKHCSKI
jgi:hypothetical protein